MNCNLRDRLFSYLTPLVERVISSEMMYVKILAYLKLLKMMCVSVLEVDVLKYVMKFGKRTCTLARDFWWPVPVCQYLPMDLLPAQSPPYTLKKLKISMGYCWKFLLPIYKLPIFKKVDCFNKFIVADALPKTMQVNVQSDVFIVFEKVLKY